MDYEEYVKLLQLLHKDQTSLFSIFPDNVLIKICNKLLKIICGNGGFYTIYKKVEGTYTNSIYTFELLNNKKNYYVSNIFLYFKLPILELKDGGLISWVHNVGFAIIDNYTITFDGVEEESYSGDLLYTMYTFRPNTNIMNRYAGNDRGLQVPKNKHDSCDIYIGLMPHVRIPMKYKQIICKIKFKPLYSCINCKNLTDDLKMMELVDIASYVKHLYKTN